MLAVHKTMEAIFQGLHHAQNKVVYASLKGLIPGVGKLAQSMQGAHRKEPQEAGAHAGWEGPENLAARVQPVHKPM